MRYSIVMPLLFLSLVGAAPAQVSLGINLPGLSIGINQPAYPTMVLVPGYPVYYAPESSSNYFFYDGLYWVYQNNEWYCSEWYNGPWSLTDPLDVPLFLLRVPVRYYRFPPPYFAGWDRDAPPRWGVHWGHTWEQRRRGWDHWDRRAAPAPAPLPVYQRHYPRDHYPSMSEQQHLQAQNYRYVPREPAVRERYQQQRGQAAVPPPTPRIQRAPQQQPSARPFHPNPPVAQHQPPPPLPSRPTPPAAQPHRPEPAQQEKHEGPHGNPSQGNRRTPPSEPGKAGRPA